MATYHKEHQFKSMLMKLRDRGLFSVAHALTMLELTRGPRIQQHLAEAAKVHPPNMVGIIGSLSDAGLIERDSTTLAWSLTKAGEELLSPAGSLLSAAHPDLPEWDPETEPEKGTRALNGVFLAPASGNRWFMQLNCGCEVTMGLPHLRRVMNLPPGSEARRLTCRNVCKNIASLHADFWAPAAFLNLP